MYGSVDKKNLSRLSGMRPSGRAAPAARNAVIADTAVRLRWRKAAP